ncbi:MAG TPA: DUF2188 domain-containing protein [Alphaproteobacteria bacterium]|nr:DUF2188 domain-containing protein [Alphaproteobacteria bacterium]
MPSFQLYVTPRGRLWEVTAGDGPRISYRKQETAIADAVEAAKRIAAKRQDAVVLLKDENGTTRQVWPVA